MNIGGSEGKRQEKLLKRFKPILDEKLKTKQRLKALQTFLEISTEEDEIKYFNEYDQVLYSIVIESAQHKIIKLRVGLLSTLCVEGNHIKLRLYGIKMVLYLLCRQESFSDDFLTIFVNAIPVNKFKRKECNIEYWYAPNTVNEIYGDHKVIEMLNVNSIDGIAMPSHGRASSYRDGTPILTITQGVIIPRELSDTAASYELFMELLKMIIEVATDVAHNCHFKEYNKQSFVDFLNSSSATVLRNIWLLFRDNYISNLFPMVSDCNGIPMPNYIENYKYCCPEELLKIFVEFLFETNCSYALSEESTVRELAIGLIHTMLWSDQTNREIVFEALRQSFILHHIELPLTLIVRLLRMAVINNESEPKSGQIHEGYTSLNQMIQKFIGFFEYGTLSSNTEFDFHYFQELTLFYRFVVEEESLKISSQTLETLMTTLLSVLDRQIKYLQLEQNFEIFHAIVETIWYVWAKSESFHSNMWFRLEETMSKYKNYKAVVRSWSALILSLSASIAQHVYGRNSMELKSNFERRKPRGKSRDVPISTKVENEGNQNSLSTSPKTLKDLPVCNSDFSINADFTPNLKNMLSDEDLSSYYMEGAKYMRKQIEDFTHLTPNLKMTNILKNIICSIGKIHEITSVSAHLEVILTLIQSWELFEKVRYLLSYKAPKSPPRFDLLGIFLRAAMMPKEYNESIAASCAVLSKMFCFRHDQELSPSWQCLFYNCIKHNLISGQENVKFSILNECAKIFTLCLPGVTYLLPTFLSCIQDLCARTDLPQNVTCSILRILGSLLVMKKQYGEKIGSSKTLDPSSILSNGQSVSASRLVLMDILGKMLEIHQVGGNAETCEAILWMYGILVLEDEVSNGRQLGDAMMILLDNTANRNVQVASAAADCLRAIAENHYRLKFEYEYMVLVIERLSFAISEQLKEDTGRKTTIELSLSANIVPILFQCLIDWVMIVPSSIISNPNISLRISEIIEETLHFAGIGIENLRETVAMKENAKEMSTAESAAIGYYNSIRECAENTLLHLTHNVDNFSPFNGPEMMSTSLTDNSPDDFNVPNSHVYFALHGHVLLTIIDLPAEKKIRLIVRNPAGKFAWDLQNFYSTPRDKSKPKINLVEYDPNMYFQGGFLTQSLIEQEYEECEYHCNPVYDIEDPNFRAIKSQILEHVEEESRLKGDVEFKKMTGLASLKIRPKTAAELTPPLFQNARLFLTHMGQLSFDYLKDGNVHMLGKSPAMLRDIRGIDKKSTRDAAKFAVLYVGLGHENEYDIYTNQHGSKDYDEFVLSLGWEIDLKTHPGYHGGLEPEMTIDGKAIYYCNSSVEIIFHDVTRMQSEPNDPKQLKKKRHIGNDHVHIVWNEHTRDYKFETIGGDFGNAQIVITPLPNNLYAIDVYKDEEVKPFGPLQKYNVVTKEYLGTLVRNTAMNAYKAAHAISGNTDIHPYTLRKETIDIIADRHKIQGDTFEKVLTSVFSEPTPVASI